jgi:hypothetical protein
LSAGGSANGDVEYQIARNKIHKGLSRDQETHLNELIQARRNIAVEENRTSVARMLMDDRGLGTVFDMRNAEHVEILKKVYKNREFKQRMGFPFLTIRKKFKDPRSEAVAEKSFTTQEEAQAYADNQVEQVLKNAEVLNPAGLKKDSYEAWMEDFKEQSPKEWNLISARANMYFAAMKSQLGHMRRAGLITEAVFNNMARVGDYSPRRYIQFFDPELTFNSLEPITSGSTQALLLDSDLLMRDYMVRLHDRIARNEANVELYNFAEKNPGNPIIKIVDANEDTKGSEIKLTVMKKGKKLAVTMPHELGVEWGKVDAALDRETASLLQTLSLSSWVRAGATGFNPGFAVTNFPRDIFFSWFRTREYNNAFPIAMWQMGKHFIKTAKDVWHTGDTPIGAAKDFLEDGGMMEFMTAEGIPSKLRAGNLRAAHPGLSAVSKYASFLGQKTELWVRVALRDRALQNRLKDGIPMAEARKEATWIARSYLDFSQGGKMIKMADKFIPYLNAGIQATRGMFGTLVKGEQAGRAPSSGAQRAENIGIAWVKFMQFFAMSSALFLNNLLDHPEKVLKTPDRDRSKSWTFYLPELDKIDPITKQVQHAYLSIALDQGQAGINAMAGLILTRFLASTFGTDGDTVLHKLANTRPEVFHDAIAGLIPWTSYVPPSMKAVLALNNINTYRLQNISHKGEMDDNGQEQLPWTHPAFIASADKLNKWWPETAGLIKSKPFSPQRLKLVWDTLFTPSNSFVKFAGLVSAGPMIDSMGGTPEEIEARKGIVQDIQRQMSNVPFISRFLKYTGTESVEDLEIARKSSEHQNSVEWMVKNKVNIFADAINKADPKDTDKINKISSDAGLMLKDLYAKGEISASTMKRHMKRMVSARGTKLSFGNVSTPRLMSDLLLEKSGGPRAAVFFSVWENASPKHRVELEENLKIVRNVGDPRTMRVLTNLIIEYKKNEGNK